LIRHARGVSSHARGVKSRSQERSQEGQFSHYNICNLVTTQPEIPQSID